MHDCKSGIESGPLYVCFTIRATLALTVLAQVTRSRVQLIPRYAFIETSKPHTSEEAIYFADVQPGGSARYPGSVFSFSDVKGM